MKGVNRPTDTMKLISRNSTIIHDLALQAKVQLIQYRLKQFLLILLIIGLSVLMLSIGDQTYPLGDLVGVLMGKEIAGVSFIVKELRLPRLLAALITGFIFGSGGSVFQSLFKNPLANPNVLGITTGSSVFAVFSIIVLQASGPMLAIGSIAGGMITAGMILLLTRINGFSTEKLVLIGIGVQATLSALIAYLLMIGKDYDVQTAMRWLTGSLNNVTLDELLPVYLATFLVYPYILYCARDLMILEWGDSIAQNLGIRVNITRVTTLLVTVCLLALATSLTGPIAAVSFLAGPISLGIFRHAIPNYVNAGLVGIVLVLGADLIGQVLLPSQYPVGIITGILGSIYLIYLMVGFNKRGYL